MRKRTRSPDVSNHKKRKSNENDVVYQHYDGIKNQNEGDRKKSETYDLRIYNNWIKSVLISNYLKKIETKKKSILDICCGKGGDLKKWKISKVFSVTFVDLVPKSIDDAKERYKRLSKYERPNAIFISSNAHTLSLYDYLTKKGIVHDLVSCQFALHYSFESEEKAINLVKNISCGLKDGGYFIGTIPNERVLKEKMKNKEDIKNYHFEIQYDKDQNFDTAGYGQKYVFYLQDAVDHVPEYLVNMELLKEIASNNNLEFVEEKNFKDFFEENRKEKEYCDLFKRMTNLDIDENSNIPLKKEFLEVIDLYVTFVFKKRNTGVEKTGIEEFWQRFQDENPRTTNFYYTRSLK
jgi:mRNA (guanine-N7-)-methyltransferase